MSRMAPSRQTRKVTRLPKNTATFHGLEKWHRAEFEKLGSMVLAQARGYNDKIVQYKKSIIHLHNSIKKAIGEFEDHNRKRDLHILMMNTEVLKEFVMKHF